jgi:hypothetical protein
MIKRMVKEIIFGNRVTIIKDSFKMIIGMGMDRCFGGMAHHIKDNG